jgi:predicted RNA methylase
MQYPVRAEIVLGDIPEIIVPEINVSYSRETGKSFLGKISNVRDIAVFFRSAFDTNTLELQEQFVVLYLNARNEIIGYYRHSKGSIHTVTADIRIVLGVALKCGCVAMLIAHNHPSGQMRPSEPDLKLTKEFKKASSYHNILLVDHLILSKDDFYSFAQNKQGGLAGVESLVNSLDTFVEKVERDLKTKVSHNKKSIEKLAAAFGITDKTEVKELTELAIVNRARELAHGGGTIKERFDKIVELYHLQVNLSHRTSQSILLQQYSTPAPISYLAGVFCVIDKPVQKSLFFEPSAGNGLLTIAGNPVDFVVNEIDPIRNRNLKTQDYLEVTNQDATNPFQKDNKRYDAVLTNPPFGVMEKEVMYETFRIKPLEHVMALRALDCMKDSGKAAIIIGGHTAWDDKGRIQAGKNRIFFNYLYSRYKVVDVINIDGHKLYARQGTAFNVRLILIGGRKQTPFGNAPVYNSAKDIVVKTFDELFTRVTEAINIAKQEIPAPPQNRLHVASAYPIINEKDNSMRFLELEAEALALELELLNLDGLAGINYINKDGIENDNSMFYEYRTLKKLHPNTLILLETTSTFQTFNEDAILLAKIKRTNYVKCYGSPFYAREGIYKPDHYKVKRKIEKAGYSALFVMNERANYVAKAYNTVLPVPWELIAYEVKHGKRHTQQDIIDYNRYLEIKDYNTKNIILFKQGRYYYTCWGNDAKELWKFTGKFEERSLVDKDGKIIMGGIIQAKILKMYLSAFKNAGYSIIIVNETSDNNKKKDNLGAVMPGNIDNNLYKKYKATREKYKSVYKLIILLKNNITGDYLTFDTDADRLVYMLSIPYTQFSNIDGRKVYGTTISKKEINNITAHIKAASYLVLLINSDDELGAPYEPASDACTVLNTQVPDSMAFETHSAIQKIKLEVGGDMDNFVRHRLQYPSKKALCAVLSAEQIDAVAMAIYNLEARNQGMIIGDQTGIGKGRVAAAMIRYGVVQGMKPVFLTEKANLFSDIYRDLSAIGSAHLKPFIVNNREPKTDIKDEDGNVIYTAPAPTEQQSIIENREVPAQYDFVVATYSQFNSPERKPQKPKFLSAIAAGNLFIMDEAHNSSGSGNTGEFMQSIIRSTRGVVFLSATFAKRPDNMPIYAMKTAISDCNMTRDDLVDAISRGGVALQEVLSSQLVGEGQMLRRERSFEGVEVNYINLDDKAQEHKAIADNITEILRDIIAFQGNHVDKEVEQLDKIAVAESKEVTIREGTSQAGVDNLPYFSKVFNVINQMLFSLKAVAVAEKTIERLKEGKKVVIAFASTMGSFIETMENETGTPVSDGDTINADFSEVLKRGLEGVLRYTEKDIDGNPVYKKFDISDFSLAAQTEYQGIIEKIQAASTGITISPIDVIIQKLKQAGYSVAEVTGRKYEMQMNWKGSKALVMARKRVNTNDAFRQFNNNEVDVLMINQSGSTGASAHAIPTAKVPKDQVKQRVMIVLQAELDISTEVQKRGRINRTGQILKPIYDYVSSAIPAERRLLMMLQKKLKSLDANTTSNQKQSSQILDVPDFLNKYGDKLVKEYLLENPVVNKLLDDPLYLDASKSDSGVNTNVVEDASMKVSGRVAVLSTKMQEDFYTDIAERYNDFVEYLKQVGEYDLEVEAMNLEAETISSKVMKMGKGGGTAFGDDSMLETVKANVLKKPFTRVELENLIKETLKGKTSNDLQEEFLAAYNTEVESKLVEMLNETNGRYDELVKDIPNEKKIKKLIEGTPGWIEAVKMREKELNDARDMQLRITEKTFNNRKQYVERILNFYYVGRLLNYPVDTFNNGSELVPTVFVGFMIDNKKKNPYAPSAMKLRFAIANSSKYLAIPASYSEEIMAIIGASADLTQPDMDKLLNDWEKYTRDNNVDRKIRHIITGNLLQAFSGQKGKLVSYTTIDKQEKKGILLPDNWNPGEQGQDNVIVPIIKAIPIVKSLPQGKHIVTNNGLSIFRNGDYFKLIIAASRTKGGDIYLDKEILSLVEKNNFEKASDKMVAMLPEKNIGKLVELLQVNHSCSITIQSHQLKDLDKEIARYSNRKKIELPPIEDESVDRQNNVISMLELEAEALTLELELLAA